MRKDNIHRMGDETCQSFPDCSKVNTASEQDGVMRIMGVQE